MKIFKWKFARETGVLTRLGKNTLNPNRIMLFDFYPCVKDKKIHAGISNASYCEPGILFVVCLMFYILSKAEKEILLKPTRHFSFA